MIAPAFALVLASTTLSVKVVSVDFAYPYFGAPGNTCQRGSVYIRAVADPQDGRSPTPVVVRLEDSAGLTPGSEAVLDVRRAGTGRDGTVVYCSAGRQAAAAAPVPPPFPAAEPLQPVEPSPPAPAVDTSAQPVASRCTSRLFNIIKKPLDGKTFGPSEFEESERGAPEAVDCSLARSRVTNVLLLRMVKDGFSKPEAVVGAEWAPNSSWRRDPDAPQRRAVKVYVEAR